uniref:phosphoserine phosphatase SerB n=1 Tax=Dietzia sp. TaxID=1871616 RepID=UPI002FDB4E5F
MSAAKSTVLITVSGPDHPGVTSGVVTVLAKHGADLLDVEQVVVNGHLTLGVFVSAAGDADGGAVADMAAEVAEAAEGLGMDITVQTDTPDPHAGPSTHVVTILGQPVSAAALGAIGAALASIGANIDTIHRIADYPVTGLELEVSTEDRSRSSDEQLRVQLAPLSDELGVDLSIERAGLARRAKRLVMFDVDSTLVQGEVIEMLAARAGREAEVAAVTERAMRGELDFAESLHERVRALEGLPATVIDDVAAEIELTPGARTTIRTLKRLGIRCGVVSGGFTQVIENLAEDLGLDFYKANTLEIVDGKLTGRVVGEVVDRQAKAEYLRRCADHLGISLTQTVAVGDGANDIDMLSAAGVGIAFCAKPALREVA